MPSFDIFVSYNSKDRFSVRKLVRKLERHQIAVWYDEDQLPPAQSTIGLLEQGLNQSSTIAVVIGSEGFGPYHHAEHEVAIQMAIEQNRRVMAVILPETPDEVVKGLPAFLRRTGYVRFEATIDDPAAWQRLLWGITGKRKPVKPRAQVSGDHRASARDQIADAVDRLAGAVRRSSSLTFVLGARSSFAGTTVTSCFSEVSRNLLLDLKLIEDRSAQHRFLPSIDTVASLYSVERGIDGLEERIARLFASGECASATLHDKLAALIKGIQQSRLLTRKLRYAGEPQLITSTSIDLACERALLKAGVSFTRIVQHRSGSRLTLNTYRDVRLEGKTIRLKGEDGQDIIVPRDAPGDLDDAIALTGKESIDATIQRSDVAQVNPLRELSLAGRPDPYLYKYHGSQDVLKSCALATDHYLRLATRPFVPDRILEIMSNSALVVLGCGLLDADVRHLQEMLLRRAYQGSTEPVPRFAIVSPPQDEPEDPYRRLEVGIWDKLKAAALQEMGITLMAGDSMTFLDLLANHLAISQVEAR